MTVVTGTITNVRTVLSDSVSPLQVAEVVFTLAGTYAQADDGIINGVGAAITASRRNGKTVALVDAMPGQPASVASDGSILGLGAVTVAADTVTFDVNIADYTTEFTNATALPAMSRPFSVLVAFTES
jgi:hypothetical protein